MGFRTEKCDVLVIGAGGAGMRAAIEAHDFGADVIIVGKTIKGKAHTVMAEGGVNAALGNVDPKDNWLVHAKDTLKEGGFLSDPEMVEVLVKESPDRVFELERWGALFDRTPDGKIIQRPFGAHSHKRTCHIGDRTGLEILQTLLGETIRRRIRNRDEVVITKILPGGAAAVDMKTGEFFSFGAKAIVIATGGAARVFRVTSNPGEAYGDGIAMAYDIGADIKDMEFIQFHPTGMVYPESARGILVTESVRGDGGILVNNKGERFMKKYDKARMELSARDVVARANYWEIHEGRGTKNKGVWLDISHKDRSYIMKKIPRMVKQFRDFADIDITKERMEVSPTAHYTMGGINTDSWGATRIKGVYAAGECSSGLHGANRLGGNSLAEILVFGRRAGLAAAKYAKKTSRPSLKGIEKERERITRPFKGKGIPPGVLKRKIQELMWRDVGIMRKGIRLKTALGELDAIKKQSARISVRGDLVYNPEWLDFLDINHMLIICEAVIRSALMREESRGAHYREDFPKIKSGWKVNIACRKTPGGMVLEKREIPKQASVEIKRWLTSQK